MTITPYMKEEKEYQVLAEKEILCKLNHPGIVKLFFAFHDKSKLYFVLEYLAGGTLSDFLESKGRIATKWLFCCNRFQLF